MGNERTFVGLDVHARSVVGCAMDTVTGELLQRRLGTDPGEIWHWIGELEGPVAVTYEAGPTGFGLARDLRAHGIACPVAAPSTITRAPGDRVKTDARDALLLARLLKLGEICQQGGRGCATQPGGSVAVHRSDAPPILAVSRATPPPATASRVALVPGMAARDERLRA